MLGLPNNNKKMVERPKEEPKFSLKNKTDRTIFFLVLGGLLVSLALLGGAIGLYFLIK